MIRQQLRGIVIALLLVAATTAVAVLLREYLGILRGSVLYLVPVMLAGYQLGVVPALLTAVAGVILSGYLFFAELYSFRVASPQEALNLVLYMVVAVVVSHLATQAKRHTTIARKREREMSDLYAFSRRLAAAPSAAEIFVAIQNHLANLFQRKVVLLGAADAGNADSVPERLRAEVARVEQDEVLERTIDDGKGNTWLIRRVSPKTPDFGSVAVDLGSVSGAALAGMRQRIDDALADAVATLERLDVARALNEAKMRSETELLREALIGSVSHELRTPLASILGAATILSSAPALVADARLHALTGVVRDEAERLNNDIQNLLDATTISRQQVRPKLQWIEPVDIVNAAVEHRRRRLVGHPVTLDLNSNLPIVRADPAQVEQALVQILTMRQNIRPMARRSASPRGPTAGPSCSRSVIAAPGSAAMKNARSASDFSADRATPPRPRAQASACGSQMPSSRPTAARSKSRVTASAAARRYRSICRCRMELRHWRPRSMSEIPLSVLVVDDEIQIRRFLRTGFEFDNFTVQEAETGAEALHTATLKPSDLVILDLGLPDMDGAEVLERLRSWSSVPLIVLSVRANEAEKVRLLELGADDYVVKPFGMAELLARARSALRRQLRAARGEPVVKFGPLSIDFAARAVFISEQRVALTPKEYRLLQILAQHSGNVVTHQFLLREVWGSQHIDNTHYLRIFVRKLRCKIEADPTQPRILLTELGVGYRLVISDPPAVPLAVPTAPVAAPSGRPQ